MTLAILASSLLLILLGALILKLPPLLLVAAGVAFVAAGFIERSCPADDAVPGGALCTPLGPDLAPALFVLGAVFLVPGLVRLARRRRPD